MKKPPATFQIGKNGVTDGTIKLLETAFIDRDKIKLVILKAGGHTKENVNKIGVEVVEKLGKNYTYKTLGFTIYLRKWRKPQR